MEITAFSIWVEDRIIWETRPSGSNLKAPCENGLTAWVMRSTPRGRRVESFLFCVDDGPG